MPVCRMRRSMLIERNGAVANRANFMSDRQIKVASSEDVMEGQLFAAQAEKLPILLSRVDGTVCAVRNRCPHMGMKMSRGKISNGIIQCPWHGSKFDICSGNNVDWVNAFAGIPMPRWTHKIISMGKSPSALTTLPVEETEEGIFVSIPETV